MADLTTISDGRRSKSQVSIYDYPEHLNPFYEDENHKRLRFWKIGKKDGGGGGNGSSRRSSFSLGGLREMWTFKSLRGKKKSSTLGINKTSESPEPLRRQTDSIYATYDPRHRNTYDNGTINGNFQRNVPYRASLQDMNYNKNNTINSNGNGIGFIRNDDYRSTIQITGRRDNKTYPGYNTPTVPPRRYVYGGSVTPQPRTRFDHNTSSEGINRGSSQFSVASSTNPFEEDDDVTIGGLSGTESGDRPTPAKRRVRKKRRAPPPPVPIPKSIIEETITVPPSPTIATTSTTQTVTSVENKPTIASRATPPPAPLEDRNTSQDDDRNFENQLQQQMQLTRDFSEQEQQEISNIAAEIEHYVKLLTQDDDDESAIRLIPLAKTNATQPPPPLVKSKSSTSVLLKTSPLKMKKAGSETWVGKKFRGSLTKGEVANWLEKPKRNGTDSSPRIVGEQRRSSLGAPTPATRQRSPLLVKAATTSESLERKSSSSPEAKSTSSSPEAKSTSSSPETKSKSSTSSSRSSSSAKPTPSIRQEYSSTDSSESKLAISISSRKRVTDTKEVDSIKSTEQDDKENNNCDNRSDSSKEHTPLNSSYDSAPSACELKITESREDISDVSNTSSERYQIRYVPLKDGSPETPPPPSNQADSKPEYKPINNNKPSGVQKNYDESWVLEQMPGKPSVDTVPKRPSGTLERRRSVKEIIDSINRSQSLLKVNKDSPKVPTDQTSDMVNNLNGSSETTDQVTTSPIRKSSKDSTETAETYRQLTERETEIKRMLIEMEGVTNQKEINNYCENVPSILDRFDEEVNNNDIFKKCILKKQLIREGSPTASNLDWNPLPKPKRTKNLSMELNNKEEKN